METLSSMTHMTLYNTGGYYLIVMAPLPTTRTAIQEYERANFPLVTWERLMVQITVHTFKNG